MIYKFESRFLRNYLSAKADSCPFRHSPTAKRFTLAGTLLRDSFLKNAFKNINVIEMKKTLHAPVRRSLGEDGCGSFVKTTIFKFPKIIFQGHCGGTAKRFTLLTLQRGLLSTVSFHQKLDPFRKGGLVKFVLVFGLFGGFCDLAWGVSPETVRLNNKGVELYKAEQFHQAYEKFNEGLAINPFDPYLQSNLGHSFLSNEEKEKAFAAFSAAQKMALQSGDPQAIFSTTFNLATMKAGQGDIEGALKDFQACLDMHPPENEVKMVRENIEKMWQAQQGQGKGGDQDQKQKNKDDQDGDGNQDQNQDQPQKPEDGDKKEPEEKKKPKPFDSKNLTKDDVRKILEELKNQEQKIRAEMYEGKGKDRPRDKDW